jgi:hypothetical protein
MLALFYGRGRRAEMVYAWLYPNHLVLPNISEMADRESLNGGR